MQRRSFLALLAAAPSLAAVLQACGDDDAPPATTGTAPTDTDAPGLGEARADVARLDADPALAALAATAVNAFGADLHGKLVDAHPDDNLVFSPASILLALTMTRAGAAGTTATQMSTVLHTDDTGDLYAAANALSASLAEVSRSVDVGDDEPAEVVLNVANSLWGQAGLELQQPFLDLLASQFGTGLGLVDYRADPEAARAAINAWVAEHTDGRIPELMTEGTVTPDSRLTLVNAIYLKAPWSFPFEPSSTSEAPFTRTDGSTVDVPTMHSTRQVGHIAGDGWQAVALDYAGGGLSMLLVLPDVALADVERKVTAAWPGADELSYSEVRLSLPRWDIETAASLDETLSELGMPLAFTDDADFSAITTQEPLKIGVVVHQANITVDEQGTEAAAATAVGMAAGAAPGQDEPITLTFDRPFLFAVRETATGAVLFQGRVADPSATR